MSWGDKKTVSEEVGGSLKCPFPVSSEPQSLLWLDPCQHRRLSLSWQNKVGLRGSGHGARSPGTQRVLPTRTVSGERGPGLFILL